MEKDSFVLYADTEQHLDLLTDEEAGQLFKAIFQYVRDGEAAKLQSPAANMAFSFLRAQIDRDTEKYCEVRERRREAGRKGGRITSSILQKDEKGRFVQANQAKPSTSKPSVPVPVPVPVSVPVSDNDKREGQDITSGADKPRQRAQFSPPPESEVISYFADNGRSAKDAAAFFDYYTANGWVQGKGKPLRDWQAAARSWIRRAGQYDTRRGQGKESYTDQMDRVMEQYFGGESDDRE